MFDVIGQKTRFDCEKSHELWRNFIGMHVAVSTAKALSPSTISAEKENRI